MAITGTPTSGNDTLIGDGSDDTINGLGGIDLMIGGAGNDTYYVDQSGDQILELSAGGTDTAYASVSYQLADQLETLILTGVASIEGTGNTSANTITGNGGNNTLTGLGGNDMLNGGFGQDIAVYSGTSSGYRIGLNNGKVTVTDSDTSNGNEGTDTLSDIEQIVFSDGALSVNRLYGEFRVNTYTADGQDDPAITTLADGGFIVTWVSYGQDDPGASDGIYAQHYDANGAAVRDEFLVNTTTTGSFQYEPSTTALADGGFVVIWTASDGSDTGLFGQMYDANGAAIGGEFDVNAHTTDAQDKHTVTALADGGFVVTWTSANQDGSNDGIYARLYDADGNTTGADLAINATTSGYQYSSSIAALGNGGFVVTWVSTAAGQDGSGTGIYARCFDADGLAVTNEFRINSTTAFNQYTPAVASLASGDFVVTWASDTQSGLLPDIYAQRYDADGNVLGLEFRVNSTTADNQLTPSIAGLADGGFIVTWTSNLEDGDLTGIYAQRYGADGIAQGAQFLVNTYTVDEQEAPTVTALNDGGFVISWASNDQDGSDYGVYAQRYGINGILYGVEGDGGNNTLSFISGSATFEGGLGNDTYIIDDAGDTVVEAFNAGTDTVNSSVSYALSVNVEKLTLTGSAGINATGNNLNNTLTGNAGNNTLDGGLGDDTMTGLGGNDTYIVSSASDKIVEAASGGTDTAITSVNYTLAAQVENLTIISGVGRSVVGNTLNNTITGGYGNDTLNGGDGKDTLKGGLGNDTYVIDTSSDLLYENSGQGTDTVKSSVTFTLGVNIENLTLTGSKTINATGNTLDNVLIGNSGNNILTGNAGDDTLNGGSGKDTLKGGLGNDTYVIDTSTDILTESAGQGTDTIQTSLTWTLGSNFENLTLTGSSAINGTGNSVGNIVTGNSGNNVLTGGGGIDTLIGGNGNDTYVIDTVTDTLTENAGVDTGTDTVNSSVTWTLGANFENLTLTGSSNLNGTGNTLNNVLTGNSGNNILSGGAGNDTYVVNTTADALIENVGEGTDTVKSSVTWTLGADFENLVLTGSNAIRGTGNALNNVLTGNSGNNTFTGFDGNDTLNGGLGKDSLAGGTGLDNFVFSTTLNASTNVDTITDFVATDDTLQLENAIFKKLTATGALNSAFFKANATGKAADANDYIIYETDTGKLFYDADGSGKGAAIQFALIGTSTHPTITAADFTVL